MNPLRKLLDKVEPIAGKTKFTHTLYDALDTFLFQPNETTKAGTHIKDGMDLKRTMFQVVIALQLCYLFGTYNIGHQHYAALGLYTDIFDGFWYKLVYGALQLIPVFIVTHLVGLGIEIFFAAKRGHAVEEGFLVTGALIPLIMPPGIPLWILAVATAFAVIIVKEAFGGTGMNVLNVALSARVFVFFAYPSVISGQEVWVSYDYNWLHQLVGLQSHTLHLKGLASMPAEGIKSLLVDGFSGATPLARAAEGGWDMVLQHFDITNMIWGFIPGSVGEMSKVAVIIGAVILIVSRIGSWRVMLSMVAGCIFAGVLMNILAESMYEEPMKHFIGVPWYYQFVMGSFFFAMAFMATDPVTAASTDMGKFIYGFMIGSLGLVIRVLNPAYPEGWMLAILFMNVFAPLIDHFVLQANIKRRVSRAVQ